MVMDGYSQGSIDPMMESKDFSVDDLMWLCRRDDDDFFAATDERVLVSFLFVFFFCNEGRDLGPGRISHLPSGHPSSLRLGFLFDHRCGVDQLGTTCGLCVGLAR